MSELIGRELGPYRIMEQVGAGGMATVYRAYHATIDRDVAVKVLPEQMSRDPEFRKRFEREAKVIARLEHAHILPVHDYGEEGGRLFLVMRYVKAGTLKERMASEPMELPEIGRILGQIGGALAYAHRLNVIHRDMKPANILLDDQDDCYLTDFGLAKMLGVSGSMQITATGVGMGTPAYMSPEQGQGENADARSDIYSLGVILYQMVTGRVPYEAETPLAVVLKHITDPLPLPSSIEPDVPPAVERVILKAMAKEPQNRYATADEMILAFEEALSYPEAETHPIEEPSPVLETPVARKLPWGIIAASIIGLLAVIGAVLAATGAFRTPAATATPLPTIQAAVIDDTPTPTPTVESTPTKEPTSTPTEVPATALSMPTPVSLDESKFIEICEGTTPLQLCVRDTETGRVDRIIDNLDFERVDTPVWSHTGRQIAFSAGSDYSLSDQYDHNLFLINADGSDLKRLTNNASMDSYPIWSTDETWIAFSQSGELVIIRPDGKDKQVILERTYNRNVAQPVWSPDDTRIAFWNNSPSVLPEVWVVDRDGSSPHVVYAFEHPLDRVKNIGWSSDGDQIAVEYEMDGETQSLLINADGSGLPKTIETPYWWFTNFWPQWGIEVEFVTPTPTVTPTATRTPRPTPTITPTPAPTTNILFEKTQSFAEPILAAIASRPPDYEDNFDNQDGRWPTAPGVSQHQSHVGGESGYIDGEFFVVAGPSVDGNHACYGVDNFTSFSGDMVLEVKGRLMPSENTDRTDDWQIQYRKYGMGGDVNGFYALASNRDQGVRLARYEERPYDLAERYGYPAKGGTEANTFQIIVRGGEIGVYVNGEPLFYTIDGGYLEYFSAGNLNLGVCNKNSTPLEARWDYIKIWYISD